MKIRTLALLFAGFLPAAAHAAEKPVELWVRRQVRGMPFTVELPAGPGVRRRGGGDPEVDSRTGGRAWTEDLTFDLAASGGGWENMFRLGYYDGWMKHELAGSPSRKTWGAPTSKK